MPTALPRGAAVPKPVSAARPRPEPDDDRRIRALAALFRALADVHRLRILSLLSEHGELSVSAIGDDLGQSQPAVSHHLRELKTAGLIDFRRDGKFNYYRLDEPGVAAAYEAAFPDGPVRLSVGGVEVSVRRK